MDKTNKKPLSGGKLNTQAAVCTEIWGAVVNEVFGQKNVADRALARFLRERKELGSRDRRFISETIFSFFRYWGVLRFLLPEEEAAQLAADGDVSKLSLLDTSRILLAANMLCHAPDAIPEAVSVWCNHLRIKLPGMWDFSSAGAFFKVEPQLWTVNNLLPDWVKDELDPAVNFDSVITAVQTRPPLWLRAQSNVEELMAELLRDGVPTIRHRKCLQALAVLDSRINLYTLDAFKKGRFEVQDLASQLIGLVCAPQSGERWWDACAGAGGKSLQLADLMHRKGTLVASDIREYKLADLKLRARRSGFPNITTKPWDGKKLSPREQARFDGVLVDAPCSCSGTWRRNPDGRWLMTPAEIEELAALQTTVLKHASGGVKPGGVLVYATCSMFTKENLPVVQNFLAASPDFELENFVNPLNGVNAPGWVLADMLENNSDSMFAARLRRKK